MHKETANWISDKALDALRGSQPLPEQVDYDLGGMPFVDHIRSSVTPEDKEYVLRLMRSPRWSDTYLATNISRPILDEEIADATREGWKRKTHFHTKLAMIYLLFHHGSPQKETEEFVEQLEADRAEFIPCIKKFYGKHPKGAWGALCERLEDPRLAGARPVYNALPDTDVGNRPPGKCYTAYGR